MTNYPVGYNLAAPAAMTADEMRKFERAWEALLSGDERWRHKALYLPSDTTVTVIPLDGWPCRYCRSLVTGSRCETCGAPPSA